MTLFGRTLGAEEIASLVFMLGTLALWLFVLRGERDWRRWFTRWEADRKARRDAEIAAERDPGDPPSGPARGPWG
ncbi:MAG: hypothetical protein A2623_10000 [Caulobacterales bacterium RIFCSPHIGHO2_01_FULL_70_19]|nr:MAG: hypothetical protein A2623_10000 [Caulobacterales bacterium RIFCSPHIGHO2_01_FULL_70_19]